MREHGSGEWTHDALLKAIKQEICTLKLETQNNHLNATASFHIGTINNNGRPCQPEPHKKYSCVFCKGLHVPTNCNAVTAPEQWQDSVKQPSSTRTALHLATVSTSTSALHLTGNNTCLLKTAIDKVLACAKPNFLFDKGSQWSFITKSSSQLKPSSPHYRNIYPLYIWHLKVPTPEDWCHNHSADNFIWPDDPTISADCPHNCSTIDYYQTAEKPQRIGLNLAFPGTTEDHFEITLLTGVHHYWDIVEDRIIRGNCPTARPSKLGYLLSGPMTSSPGSKDATNSIPLSNVLQKLAPLRKSGPLKPWRSLNKWQCRKILY